MEEYRVTQTGDEIQGILNQSPIDTADIAELKEAATSLDGRLESVEGKIPAGASEDNPLTDKQYVNDSIASASATFRGTYNEVTDLELTTDATHADIGSALDEVIELADSNDYCFVQIPTDDETPTEIESIERYKFVTGTGWQYEYTLNNSGFTADQWAAINSGITSGFVAKLADLPTNAELENLLNGKANAADVYTKSETYNKTELDAQLGEKANSADVYAKTDTYTKQEVDALITTPEVQYVTVTATSGTTSVTDVLPATGAANTIYRVGSWDGTQYDDGVYSEYSWNGSAYILLDVKNYGLATGSDFNNPTSAQRSLVTTVGSVLDGMPEGVFDVSARNSGSTWASLSALLSDADLDTLIPASWRKGGMTIRFVQTSDNNYVQYRLMADEFTTDTAQWQGVDEKPTYGSNNLPNSGGVKSSVDNVQGQISGQVVNLEMGRRFLDNGYSAGSTYACTNILTGDGGQYVFPKLSDIGATASYYVYKYISDSEGEEILGNGSAERTATISGKFIVTFGSVDSDDFDALVSNFYIGGLQRGSLNQRVAALEGGSILTNDLVKTTSNQGLSETQKANALNNLGISTELNEDSHTVPIIPEECVKEGNKTLSEKLEEIDDAIYISEGGWETLTITPVDGSLIKLDGNILSSNLRAYYTGLLEAGTYKITGRSENSNYPFLATSDTGTGNYTRVLGGDKQLYTDEVVTFNSAKYVHINGNKEGDNRIIIKKNTQREIPVNEVVEELDSRVTTLEGRDGLPIRISATQATDAQGRSCRTYHISRRLDNTVDFVTRFGNKYNTPNANFDFYGIQLKDKANVLGDGADVVDGSYFRNQTDFIMPLVVAAVENNNGDFPDNTSYFTGGFHGYGNATTSTTAPTSRVVSQNVYADGKLVSVGDDIFCNKVRMEVITNVQACNTEVEDGTGREVIQQKIIVEIDALRTDVKVEWTALEAVTIYQLDGFGAYAPSTNYVRFIGSDDRGSYPSGTLKRTYTQPNICRVSNPDDYKLDIVLDKVYDAGDYRYNTNSETLKAQVTTANKVYYHLVGSTPVSLAAGDMISYRGSYNFGKV